MNLIRIVLAGLLAVFTFLTLLAPYGLQLYAPNAELQVPKDIVYAFKVDLSSINVLPRYVILLNETRVAIVGSFGEVNGIGVLSVTDPHTSPTLEELYPITGSPTRVATDGFPVTRIAVGSDRGEILVFRVEGGRILKYLDAVLGADFYVDKLFLARDRAGNIKVIALVAEGGSRGYPCMNCFIYVMDEDARGILRVGPKVGNATPTCSGLEGVQVLDVVPLSVYDTTSYFFDASNVAVMYIPKIIPLVFNVTYVDVEKGEVKALPGALVGVSLLYNKTGVKVVYGVNADSQGIARVPIPAERETTLIVNLTIADIAGAVQWQYTYIYSPEKFEEVPSEIYLPSAVLPNRNVDLRPATKIYGVPPFLASIVDLIDLSGESLKCNRKTQVLLSLKPSVGDLTLIRGSTDPRIKFMYTDPDSGVLSIIVAPANPLGSPQILRVDDYVGGGSRIVAAGTYTDGSYLIAGLSDGRVRLYTAQGQGYILKHIYSTGSTLSNLIAIPNVNRDTYVALSSSGVAVIKVEPRLIPVYRKHLFLYLSTGDYICGDVLADLSTIALVNSTSLVVVKNSETAVRENTVLALDEILTRNVEVAIYMPGREALRGVFAVLKYPWGSTEYILTGNVLTLSNIIPGVTYTLDIRSPVPYIYNSSISFVLRDNRLTVLEVWNSTVRVEPATYRLAVNMWYMVYPVKLQILDKVTGNRLVAPIDVLVDGKVAVESTRTNEHFLQLVYGPHNITIRPARGFENVYQVYTASVNISSETSITATLSRRLHNLLVTVVEQNRPISNVAVYIYSIETGQLITVLTTDTDGVVKTGIPYGVYKLVFNHEKYAEETFILAVDKDLSEVVSLRPTIYTLFWRYVPVIGGLVAVGLVIYIALKIRVIIARRLAREEVF